MKIGIVCYPTLGGSGIVATELGHELAMRGHEVHFITYEIPFRLRLEDKNIYFHEVEIHHYDLFKYPDYALSLSVKIASIAEQFDLDVLHVHYAIPHAASAFLAKQILGDVRPVVITTLHGTDITLVGRDPIYFKMVKFSIEQSCAVTSVSQHLKEETQKLFEIDRPIEVIPNFFTPKPEIVGKKPVRHHYVRDDEKLIIHSSNYRDVKRASDVVRIFQRIRKQMRAKLLFLGTGKGLEEVRVLANELNLLQDIHFIGKSSHIDLYIASADLFLLPSQQESFGLAALEAMAYGIPVVASNTGGLPELIEDGVSGFLAPVGDIEKMSYNSLEILKDDRLSKILGENAAKIAQEKFNTKKIVSYYEDFYSVNCRTKKLRSNI